MSDVIDDRKVKDNIKRLELILAKASLTSSSYKRFGRDHDGGYVLVNDISKDDFGISLGIAGDVSWDKDFMKFASGIHMYDNSIDSLPEEVVSSTFFKETIGQDVGMDEIVLRTESIYDLILKMDIEGAEVATLKKCSSDSISRFRQIVVEFHNIIDYVEDRLDFKDLDDAISKILQTHLPVWLHVNNYGAIKKVENFTIPDVLEVLFLRKSSYSLTENSSIPGQFDGLNMQNNPKSLDNQLFLGSIL